MTIGKKIIAIAFNKKTIVIATKSSWGFALIIGATAAIAVPPQIAAPDDNKNATRWWMPRILPRISPEKKETITNSEIQGKYSELTFNA